MAALLFLAFLAMPLLELWVILQVGDVIGGWWTIALLLADSIAGAYIVRREGRRAWTAFRDAVSAGRWPADEVAQGALVLIGGALLLTPGFVTDVIGLAFVLPPTRRMLAALIRARVKAGAIQMVGFGDASGRDGADRGPQTAARSPRRSRPDRPDQPQDAGGSGEVLDVEVVSIERDEEA